MKPLLVLISIIGLGVCSYAQELKKPKYVPFMVEVDTISNFYMKTTEVSIVDWFVFLDYFAETDGVDEALKMLPTVFDEQSYIVKIFKQTLQNKYGDWDGKTVKVARIKLLLTKDEHKNINDADLKIALNLPVTGVKHEWISLFLEFEGDMLNSYASMYRSDYRVSLRLPTEKEWEDIAKKNIYITAAHQGKGIIYTDTVNASGCALIGSFAIDTCKGALDKIKQYGYLNGPVQVGSYSPSPDGLFCLFGNAAEMVSDHKTRAKGGSYKHYAKETQWNRDMQYFKPQPWIGFRYVGILEKG